MDLPPRIARRLRSARTWIALGVLAPVGMLAVSALMLLDLRRDAWDKADQTSRNLLRVPKTYSGKIPHGSDRGAILP